MMNNYHFDIVISGFGIISLTTALSLCKYNVSIAIINHSSLSNTEEDIYNPRLYTINSSSKLLLKKINIWDKLKNIIFFNKIDIIDLPNESNITFDSEIINNPQLGYIVQENILKNVLLKQILNKKNISIFYNIDIQYIKDNEDDIYIYNNENIWISKLFIIADGTCSKCRKILNVPIITWNYHQSSIISFINTEKIHNNTIRQIFYYDEILAILPSYNDYLCSIIWTFNEKHKNKFMSINNKHFNEILTIRSNNILGNIHSYKTRYIFPLIMCKIKQYTGKNWIILGNAAHTIHPLAGLGLNIGFADIIILLSIFNIDNIIMKKNMLKLYQVKRNLSVWKIILLLDSFKFIFSTSYNSINVLKKIGIKFFNLCLPIKKKIIEQAMWLNIKNISL